jgi:DNA-binding NtrC family response regulator
MASAKTDQQPRIHILIVDDQLMWRTTTEKICTDILASLFAEKAISAKDAAKFFLASTVEEAVQIMNDVNIHLLLLDKDLGVDIENRKITGIDFIRQFKSIQPLCQVLMLTADNSVRDMAQAFRNGASDYLFKSNEDGQKEYRLEVIRKALQLNADEIEKAKSSLSINGGLYSNYVCNSAAMQRFDNKLLAVSESNRPVLILGATGLGKGAAARRVSELRAKYLGRASREFVQINIGATDKAMAESILFGTEPGAFTDASKKTKAGLLDIAGDGDVFLDEIGDASLELQLKLLKVVEEREFYRVGGNRPIKTKARFIFATNKDLRPLIAAKQFREDLYMRISVFEETLPPLSERKEDVPLILQGLLQAACAEAKNKKMSVDDFPSELMSYFLRENITGNIRGIENDVQRLVAHTKYDENGRPDLSQWKKALGSQSLSTGRKVQILNAEQLLTAKTNFLDQDFPGLWELTHILEKRVLEEVEAKGLSIEQASKILKVSVNTVWSRQKQFKAELKRDIL